MNKEQAIELSGKYFPYYPTVNEFYFTHDGQAFIKIHDADNHARTFKKTEEQSIITVARNEWEASQKEEEKDTKPAANSTTKKK